MPADMQTLYYSEWQSNVSYEIWISNWDNNNWTQGMILPSPINTVRWEYCPTISADGDILYFSRRDSVDYDNDIYVSYWLTSVENTKIGLVDNIELIKYYPNPFNQNMNIEFSIKKNSPVWLQIFNTEGKEIYSHYFGFISSGEYVYIWDGKTKNKTSIGSGVYFIKILSGVNSYQMSKIICLK
jgi:hypothetical protein